MIIDPYTWQHFVIEDKVRAASDTIAIRFKRPAGYVFRAGQYAIVRTTVGEGRQLIRQYSFSSAPEDEMIELLIQREPSGEVSNWFFDEAKLGDTIELSQPFGGFTLDPSETRPVLMIAGRVGIAPFLSMLREGHKRSITLLYSVRSENQLCFPGLLERFDSNIIVTERSPRIDKTLLAPMLEKRPQVYICGSKQFVDAIASYLHSNGVSDKDIRRELFTLQ